MPRKKKHKPEAHPDERWLLTYADMLTLLLALFVVMYSISSVNVAKFEGLQRSLQDAFNGSVLTGGQAILKTGGQETTKELNAAPPSPSLQAAFAPRSESQGGNADSEQQELKELEQLIKAEANRQGIASKVQTELAPDGLTVRLNTDGLFFDPGSAVVKAQAAPLVHRLARLLRADSRHAVMISGHTDSQPISGQYPSNWELSTARASAIVRALVSSKVSPARLTATGRAYFDPLRTNATARGRAENRRVELFIPRMHAVGTN